MNIMCFKNRKRKFGEEECRVCDKILGEFGQKRGQDYNMWVFVVFKILDF